MFARSDGKIMIANLYTVLQDVFVGQRERRTLQLTSPAHAILGKGIRHLSQRDVFWQRFVPNVVIGLTVSRLLAGTSCAFPECIGCGTSRHTSQTSPLDPE